MFHVSILSVALSKIWVSLLGGASRKLVGPLVDSLKYPMVAERNPVQNELMRGAKSFHTALKESVDGQGCLIPNPRDDLRRIDDRAIRRARRVRSVQRMPLPESYTARLVAEEYYRWLPTLVRPLLRCELVENKLQLCLGFTRWLLVEFTHSRERSTEDRQLFYITGGILARTRNNAKGRIEFREMLDRRWVLAAIHDYSPMLPWYFYSATQALVHLMVMRNFAKHLGRIRDAEVANTRTDQPRP